MSWRYPSLSWPQQLNGCISHIYTGILPQQIQYTEKMCSIVTEQSCNVEQLGSSIRILFTQSLPVKGASPALSCYCMFMTEASENMMKVCRISVAMVPNLKGSQVRLRQMIHTKHKNVYFSCLDIYTGKKKMCQIYFITEWSIQQKQILQLSTFHSKYISCSFWLSSINLLKCNIYFPLLILRKFFWILNSSPLSSL